MKIYKVLIMSLVMLFGIFLFMGTVSANSEVNALQPAEAIEYNENIIVNSPNTFGAEGAAYFSGGLHVKSVTYFNGTMINTTSTDGVDNPITISDTLRVDDAIFRIEPGGKNPIKISDTILPTTNSLYSLGMSDYRWNNIYAKYGDYTGNLSVNGRTTSLNGFVTDDSGITIKNTDVTSHIGLSDNGLRLKGDSTSSKYVDISSNGSVSASGGISANGTINANSIFIANDITQFNGPIDSDIEQELSHNGAVKALVEIESDGSCSDQWSVVSSSSITCTDISDGTYELNFPFGVTDRYVQVTAKSSSHIASYSTPAGPRIVRVYTHRADQGGLEDSASTVIVY